MSFEYGITVGALPSAATAELGHALERLAFFPGITKAAVVGHDADSITIGYNGHPCSSVIRELSAELAAEGLVARGGLWQALPEGMGRDGAIPLSALYRRDIWGERFRRPVSNAKPTIAPGAAATEAEADTNPTFLMKP